MPLFLNTSIATLEGFADGVDTSALDNFALQHQARVTAFFNEQTPTVYTTLTSTLVVAQQGAFTIRTEGSGIGPVSTAAQLEQALADGLANGTITRISVSDGAGEFLSLTPSAGGYTLRSGTTELVLSGALPTSLEALGALQADLMTLVQDGNTLDAAARAALVTRLNAYDIDGLSLIDDGDTLVSLSLGEDSLSLSSLGYSFSLNGSFPENFGELVSVAFELYDLDLTHTLTGSQDIALRFMDEALTDLGTYVDGVTAGPNLPTGRYYVEVSAFDPSDVGVYELRLLQLINGQPFADVTPGSETTDAPANSTTPYVLTYDSGIVGALDFAGDHDWYAFDYTEGDVIRFYVPVPTVFDLLTGLEVTSASLTAPDGTVLASGETSLGDLAEDATGFWVVEGQGYRQILLDSAQGGVENDLVHYAWESSLVLGFGGNDEIHGSDGDDRFLGGAGADYLSGWFGNDILEGGAGDDTLDGGEGDDNLYGEWGNDSLTGGNGHDRFEGGWGNDTLEGGAGFDLASYAEALGGVVVNLVAGTASGAGVGSDSLSGIEDIEGGAFGDQITGDAEDNWLYGLGGDDTMTGGDGDDRLYGGSGNDLLSGGTGDDSFYGDVGNDTLNGGDGVDFASYSDAMGSVVVDLAAGTASGAGVGNDSLGSIEILDGSAFGDRLLGNGADNALFGLGGNDTLSGGGGNDTLSGDVGADLLYSGGGDDSLLGGDGNDTLFGGADNDILEGGEDNDLLGGGAGDDLIFGDLGDDALWGSTGNDTLSGGDGNDTLGGAAGDDSLEGGAGEDELWGSLGSDTLSGGDGNDLIGGADGDDSLEGGAGDDELWGAAGTDTLSGGDGADQIGGGTWNDLVDGGSGNDSLYGGLGDDTVIGGAGDDLIYGAAGNDSLDGGIGNDTIYAGPGNDTVVYGDGADELQFFSATQDRLQLDDALWGGGLTAAQVVSQFGSTVGADFVLDFGGGDSVTLVGLGAVTGLESQIDIV